MFGIEKGETRALGSFLASQTHRCPQGTWFQSSMIGSAWYLFLFENRGRGRWELFKWFIFLNRIQPAKMVEVISTDTPSHVSLIMLVLAFLK